MKRMENDSIDSIVTDPPAGIAFMGKSWDHDKGGRNQWIAWMTEVAIECLRVTKPGGHALVWSLPRTSHWTATAWEDAGWEVRDKVIHIFGTGFPKSLDISKQLDKMAGVEREVVGKRTSAFGDTINSESSDGRNLWCKPSTTEVALTGDPITDAAKQWSGYGTALKPAHEDWILLRKPVEGTIAQNVLTYGVGGINIDGCRVDYINECDKLSATPQGSCTAKCGALAGGTQHNGERTSFDRPEQKGRFPANLILDETSAKLLDEQTGILKSGDNCTRTKIGSFLEHGGLGKTGDVQVTYGDKGGASRFFYCAKPSPQERGKYNKHPTVKSIALMKYLCRLITPPNGIVLDPFGGSGSTAIAAREEGFNYILIEKEKESVDTAIERLKEWMEKSKCPN